MRLAHFVFGLSAMTLAACEPSRPAEETAAAVPATLPAGSTLSYVRSNRDGTRPEQIFVHVVSANEVHVAKMVERCTDAAYVTAVFDTATGEATKLVGGRLQKDGTQLPQAFLAFDPATRKIEVRLGDPASPPSETFDAPPAPWRMYDFDFAEFALFGPREAKDFTFGLALAWPDTAPPMVSVLGEARAVFLNPEPRNDLPANRFRIEGPAFGALGGEAVFNSAHGYLVEARLGRPNHSEYMDFLLKLDSLATDTGDQVWRDALAGHWRDC